MWDENNCEVFSDAQGNSVKSCCNLRKCDEYESETCPIYNSSREYSGPCYMENSWGCYQNKCVGLNAQPYYDYYKDALECHLDGCGVKED